MSLKNLMLYKLMVYDNMTGLWNDKHLIMMKNSH